MYQLILILLSISTSFIFTTMTHPLAMGMNLLVQTTTITILAGSLTQSFWFSYILFLVFLGGLLVLFIYVTSLASNEMFSLSLKILAIPILLTILVATLVTVDSSWMAESILNSDSTSVFSTANHQEESMNSLTKLYNTPTSLITLTLVLYLFLALIAIVKITKINQGPLRLSN
uniref:NADH-ubiquinone oxidoreductase chain 6 n=1 Tax=Indonemoura jacobsoni TaxID=2605905 RepID=A0A5C0AVC0_9NEOP|nr:NADH dehydrogenase subunit 6 [Indonemoura jacobsoni]QEI04327.1 NADH dehydrogenase subunit 6 [Indonemoura jacobsoni]